MGAENPAVGRHVFTVWERFSRKLVSQQSNKGTLRFGLCAVSTGTHVERMATR
jgi:hypothetical protein